MAIRDAERRTREDEPAKPMMRLLRAGTFVADHEQATTATTASSVARMMSFSETVLCRGLDMLFSVSCTDPRWRLRESSCRWLQTGDWAIHMRRVAGIRYL